VQHEVLGREVAGSSSSKRRARAWPSSAVARAFALLSSLAPFAGCGAAAEAPVAPVVVIEPAVAPAPIAAPSASVEVRHAEPSSDDVIAWESDERAARERARREHRPMLVWIRADWDAASLRQERELWTDRRVVAAVRRFVTVRLDVSDVDAIASKAYADRYDVQMLPTIVLVSEDGRVAAKLAGGAPAKELFGAMRAVE
jgi:thiol:disulfide interchange protein